jgi:hypothetical protein
MVDVSEHVYDDDPARGHPDVRTRLRDVAYFFLGNGLIQAAIQHAPAGEGTPLGVLVMDPEKLRKKRDALTMHRELGLQPTVVRVAAGARELAPAAGSVTASWAAAAPVPTVSATWHADGFAIEERFCCPSIARPRLARGVTVRNAGRELRQGTIRTGAAGAEAAAPFSLPPDESACVWFLYDLDAGRGAVDVQVTGDDPLEDDAVRWWAERTRIRFEDPLLDHLFLASRLQLPAVVSAKGRMDGSIWQYNREWVRDQAFAALALVQLGHRELAATILRRLLTEFVTAEGATLDSSEVRQRDDAELDQNGVLLFVLGEYAAWTGDAALAAGLWDRVAAVAEYPLRPEFRHAASGMLSGCREFWERHAAHGITPGLELVHQSFVSLGLSSAAHLARRLGRTSEAERWQAASGALHDAMLGHPAHRLCDARGFIKRRATDGSIQESIVARPDAGLPDGVPLAAGRPHLLNPDTCCVLPIAFGAVPPDSEVARATMRNIETLWDQEWDGGGYGRYHVSSEPDSPGAWPFASIFVARAAIEAGDSARAWRVLRWLGATAGAPAGSWFEFNGPRIAPPFPQVGVIPWTWAELVILFVHHVLGVRPRPEGVVVRPRLLSGMGRVEARLPILEGWLDVNLRTDEKGPADVEFVLPYWRGRKAVAGGVRPLP